jgi:hypothetical protein
VSKPNDPCPDGAKSRSHRRLVAVTAVALVATAGMLLQLPVGATGRIADRIAAQDPPPPPAPGTGQKTGTYQLRCWQYGRLLFEEGPVTLGAEARQGARLVAIDRYGSPLIVTDAGGTTCLARPSAPPPSLALPR